MAAYFPWAFTKTSGQLPGEGLQFFASLIAVGGQGVLLMGNVLGLRPMPAGKQVTTCRVRGEMRGGTANAPCNATARWARPSSRAVTAVGRTAFGGKVRPMVKKKARSTQRPPGQPGQFTTRAKKSLVPALDLANRWQLPPRQHGLWGRWCRQRGDGRSAEAEA